MKNIFIIFSSLIQFVIIIFVINWSISHLTKPHNMLYTTYVKLFSIPLNWQFLLFFNIFLKFSIIYYFNSFSLSFLFCINQICFNFMLVILFTIILLLKMLYTSILFLKDLYLIVIDILHCVKNNIVYLK